MTASTKTIAAGFDAFRIHSDDAGYRSGIDRISLVDLAPGEIVIRTAYSSVNFKDALAGTGQGKILRSFPLVGASMSPAMSLPRPMPASRKATLSWSPAAA